MLTGTKALTEARSTLRLIKMANQVLKAHYQQIEQVGVDLQATIDSWLFKGEVIFQDNSTENYWASQLGVEYTFYGIAQSQTDLGVLLEYGKDQRGKSANAIMQK